MNFVLNLARAIKATPVLGAILGVLLFSAALFSQGSFGRIIGTVSDQTGGVISGATVTIIDKDRGVAATLTTDAAGEFNAPTLIPSTYTVRAEAKGFRRLERQNVVIQVGGEVRVDLTVQPGEQTQTVTVTESIPLVETTNATLGGTLSNAEVVDLPLNGRLYQNLLSLRPGIVTQPGGTAWTQSTNGGRPDQTVWMVDGVINTGFYDATPLNGRGSPFTDGATIVPIDAIQEFTMEESPKAEYGWKPGAVVNVGIRSGTNNLHGTAYAFGRSNAFDARNLFNPGPDSSGNCVPNPNYAAQCNKLPTEFKQFGATVGGPIKKDKLFFFGAYEGLRSFVGNVFIESVPAASAGLGTANSMPDAITALQTAGLTQVCSSTVTTGCLSPVSLAIMGCTGTPAVVGSYSCTGAGGNGAYGIQHAPVGTNSYQSNFPNRNTSDNGVGKLEYRPNNKNLVTALVMVSNYSSLGEDHPITNFNFENTVPIRTYTYTGNWIYTPGSSVVNDFRISYARYNICLCNNDQLLADGVNYPLNTGVTSTPGFPSVYFGDGFGAAGGFTLGTWGTRPGPINKGNPYYDLQDSVSYLRGKHSLKFGVEYAHIEADLFSPGTRGRINFSGKVAIPGTPGIAKGASALEDFFAGLPGKKGGASAGTLLVNPKPLRFLWRSTAVFAQDDWRVTPRLMINLGLRYSYTSPLREANGLIANFDPTSPTGLVQQGPGVGQIDSLIKPDKLNFSPRLGFAWDVTGKGTTVVRGGSSIIYSQWQVASMFGNPGPAGDSNHQTSPANNPSGFVCGAATAPAGPLTGCPNSNFGGTIQTGVLQLTGANIPWNGAVGLPGGAGILSDALSLPPTCNTTAPTNIPTSTGVIGGCDLFALDPNMKNAYVLNWSLGITHAFNSNLSLEVGYVGNRGIKLSEIRDINACQVVNGVTKNPCVQPYATQFPYFDVINYASDNAHSNYNSLQSTLTERVTHGLSFTGGYTYSHALDNGSLSRFGGLPQNQYAPLAEYASSDLDIRHRFTLSGTYNLPGKKGFGQMLEGWSINTVLSLQTGMPWLPIDTSNNFANDTPRGHGGEQTQRWNFFGNPADFKSGSSSLPFCSFPNAPAAGVTFANIGAASCSTTSGVSGLVTTLPSSLANACTSGSGAAADPNTLATGGCFVSGNSVMTPPASNHFGNMGRNTFRDLGFKDWDVSVFKNFKFTERFGAQFRVEVFNVLNHPIIANPYGAAPGGVGADPSTTNTFGCGCATPDVGNGNAVVGSGGPRVMQLGLKLNF